MSAVVARIEFLVLVAALAVAALSTGADFLFFLLYLVTVVGAGAYLLTRFGLTNLEAGYALGQLHGTVGDQLRITYTIRSTGRVPKPWLEIEQPSNLPVALPPRALNLGSRGERTWMVRVPLTRRGHYRIEPLEVRTCDPFGLFEATATVGTGATLVVYPRVEALPFWRLPASSVEGTHASRERTHQTTPLVTSVRPYDPGDAFNRIHWPTTARQQELYVREFDLEQAADAWIFLDLDRSVHAGTGDESTIEAAVRVAAAVGGRALAEKRALGLTAYGRHLAILPADRGPRQYQKFMAALAGVQADGDEPLVEILSRGLGRMRRGMTAVVVTPSLDPRWIRPLARLRSRGVATVVCHLDPLAYEAAPRADGRRSASVPVEVAAHEGRRQALHDLHRELAENDLAVHAIVPRVRLGELMISPGGVALRRAG